MGITVMLSMKVDTGGSEIRSLSLFSRSLTYNLCDMCKAVNFRGTNLYKVIFRHEELKVTKAFEITPYLEEGLSLVVEYADTLKILNPKNGWGSYTNLVNFLKEYIEATKEDPKADIEVWR